MRPLQDIAGVGCELMAQFGESGGISWRTINDDSKKNGPLVLKGSFSLVRDVKKTRHPCLYNAAARGRIAHTLTQNKNIP